MLSKAYSLCGPPPTRTQICEGHYQVLCVPPALPVEHGSVRGGCTCWGTCLLHRGDFTGAGLFCVERLRTSLSGVPSTPAQWGPGCSLFITSNGRHSSSAPGDRCGLPLVHCPNPQGFYNCHDSILQTTTWGLRHGTFVPHLDQKHS